MRKLKEFPKGVCPTCQQSISGMPLTIDVQNNIVIYDDIVVHMAPRQIEIMEVLDKAFPNAVSTDDIYNRVWGLLCENNSTPMQAVGIQVHLANKILSLLGIKIENVFMNGYRLSVIPNHSAVIHKRRAA